MYSFEQIQSIQNNDWRSHMITRLLICGAFIFTSCAALANTSVMDGASSIDEQDLLLADNRRDDRRDDRQDDRDDKQDCRDEDGLVGGDKRDCKQESRGDDDEDEKDDSKEA
jgi:hypothetical protein